MDDLETKFLHGQHLQPLVRSRYIDDIFSSGPMVKRVLRNFQMNLTDLTNTWNLLMSTV